MRAHRFIVGLASVLVLFAGAASAAAQQWKTYSFPADSFTAGFPAEPDQTSKELDTANGKVEVRTFAAQDGQTALLVAVSNYRKGLKGRDPQAVLEAGRQGMLESTGSKAGPSTAITLAGNPGLAFTAESDSALITVRIFLAGDNVYQLLVYSQDKKPYARAQQFFDSFQLSAAGLK